MWTVECLSTDRFHSAPLSARSSHHATPVCFDPAQSAVARVAHNVNYQEQQKEAAENDAEEQLRRNQLLKEICVKRNQCKNAPIHPLGNSTDLHFWITLPPIDLDANHWPNEPSVNRLWLNDLAQVLFGLAGSSRELSSVNVRDFAVLSVVGCETPSGRGPGTISFPPT